MTNLEALEYIRRRRPTTDNSAYDDYCRWCESLGIEPPDFDTWQVARGQVG